MLLKEKVVVIMLGAAILGAIAYLLLFAPIGSLGYADGQSYDVDRFSIIGYLVFLLAAGYFVVRFYHRRQQQAKIHTQEAEPDDAVWPPPPKTY